MDADAKLDAVREIHRQLARQTRQHGSELAALSEAEAAITTCRLAAMNLVVIMQSIAIQTGNLHLRDDAAREALEVALRALPALEGAGTFH